MPRPANADSRCSTVEMRTSPSISDVDKVVSPTFSARARISTGGSISTRRNTMPASTAAGRRVRYTFSPLWRPTPVARITFFSVLCLIIRVTLSVSPAGTTTRVWRHGSIAASAYPILGPAAGRLSIRLATQESGNIQVLEIASFRRRGRTITAAVGYLVLMADHGGPFKLRVIGLTAAVVILVGQLDRLLLRLVLAAEAGGHHRHPQFIGHLRVDYSTYDHRGVVGCKFLDGIADFFEFTDRHVEAGGDVHQDALGAHEIDILQQRAVHRRLGRLACAILAGGAARTHHRHAHLAHHGAHVGKVDVDEARPGYQLGDALHRALQHIVGGLEGIEQGNALAQHRQQLLVGNGDQRIDVLRQLFNALLRHQQALLALERKRLGQHRHGKDAEFARRLRDAGRAAGARAAAHAGGDEQHVDALDPFDDAVAIFHRRLAAHVRIGAGAEALGDAGAELQHGAGRRITQRLRIGVGAHELHALDAALHHVFDRVAAAAADADDLDHGVLRSSIHEFKHMPSPLNDEKIPNQTQSRKRSIRDLSQTALEPTLHARPHRLHATAPYFRRSGLFVAVLAAEQQQTDPGRIDRIAHYVHKAGDVLR